MILDELLELAVTLARAAGDGALAGRRASPVSAGPSLGTKSTATDLVTAFDRAAERAIVDGVAAARPDDAIVGEEGTDRSGTSGIRWFVDPIDGTTNFVYDLPAWTTSIAAGDASGMLVGVVYAPALGELFTATRGGGATLNGHPIAASGCTDLALALVGTGFAYDASRRRIQAALVADLIGDVRDIRRLGSAALDLCFVAAGRYDAYYETGLQPWDAAAGELIAREAGCRSGDHHGGAPRPAELLVATPGIFDALQGRLGR
jgi:myo-inositol-1(or 4)-monophosphatase